MAPKKRQKLQTPVVSPEEEAEAKKYLENTNNQKKAHSSMTWYLKSVQAKPEYDGWSIGAKREYFVAFTAEHLKTKGAKVQKCFRSVETAKQKEKQYVWMSEKKAKLLTQSGKLSHRPCPITGDDSTFGREWRIPTDMETEVESDRSGMQIQSEVELNWSEETVKEAIETMDSCSANIAVSSEVAANLAQVKKELDIGGGTEPTGPEQAAHEKTLEALKADPRKVGRIVGDALSDLKVWFAITKEKKYCEALHEDVKLELAKFVAMFKALEDIEIEMKTDRKPDEGSLVALAKDVDLAMDSFFKLQEWVAKICDIAKAKNVKKVKG